MFGMNCVLCCENKSLDNFKKYCPSFEISRGILSCQNVWKKYFLKSNFGLYLDDQKILDLPLFFVILNN